MTRAHIRIPSALQFDETISRGARDLWAALDDLAREHAGVYATAATVCAAVDASTRSVQRWRDELVKTGWLLYDAPKGRGVPSLWVPLRRARVVRDRTPVPVDNSVDNGPVDPFDGGGATWESRPSWPTSDQGKSATVADFSPGLYKERAREEQKPAEGPGVVITVRWCGRCASDTYRWVVTADGDPVRHCPTCHPRSLSLPDF